VILVPFDFSTVEVPSHWGVNGADVVVASLVNLGMEVLRVIVSFEDEHSATRFSIQKLGFVMFRGRKRVEIWLMIPWWLMWFLRGWRFFLGMVRALFHQYRGLTGLFFCRAPQWKNRRRF
jgi:hypothetical protein